MDPIQNRAYLCLIESPKIRGFGYSRPEGMIDYQKIQKEEFHLPQYQFHTLKRFLHQMSPRLPFQN